MSEKFRELFFQIFGGNPVWYTVNIDQMHASVMLHMLEATWI